MVPLSSSAGSQLALQACAVAEFWSLALGAALRTPRSNPVDVYYESVPISHEQIRPLAARFGILAQRGKAGPQTREAAPKRLQPMSVTDSEADLSEFADATSGASPKSSQPPPAVLTAGGANIAVATPAARRAQKRGGGSVYHDARSEETPPAPPTLKSPTLQHALRKSPLAAVHAKYGDRAATCAHASCARTTPAVRRRENGLRVLAARAGTASSCPPTARRRSARRRRARRRPAASARRRPDRTRRRRRRARPRVHPSPRRKRARAAPGSAARFDGWS